jgi:hypothetical protein
VGGFSSFFPFVDPASPSVCVMGVAVMRCEDGSHGCSVEIIGLLRDTGGTVSASDVSRVYTVQKCVS